MGSEMCIRDRTYMQLTITNIIKNEMFSKPFFAISGFFFLPFFSDKKRTEMAYFECIAVFDLFKIQFNCDWFF